MRTIVFLIAMGLIGAPNLSHAQETFTESADASPTASPTPEPTETPAPTPSDDPITGEDTVDGVEVPEMEPCPTINKLKVKIELDKKKLKTLFGLTKIFSKNKGKGEIKGKIMHCDPEKISSFNIYGNEKKIASVNIGSVKTDGNGVKYCEFKSKKFKLEKSSWLGKHNEKLISLVAQHETCGEVYRAIQWKNSWFGSR